MRIDDLVKALTQTTVQSGELEFTVRAFGGREEELIAAVYPMPGKDSPPAERMEWFRSIEATEVAVAIGLLVSPKAGEPECTLKTCSDALAGDWVKAARNAVIADLPADLRRRLHDALQPLRAGLVAGSDDAALARVLDTEADKIDGGSFPWLNTPRGPAVKPADAVVVLRMLRDELDRRAKAGRSVIESVEGK